MDGGELTTESVAYLENSEVTSFGPMGFHGIAGRRKGGHKVRVLNAVWSNDHGLPGSMIF